VLTTTVDGLWVLQVLTGIEVLAPELGLRPHLPSIETKQMALAHPVTTELRAEAVIDESGVVDEAIVEWLTVVSRRDIALLLQLRTPADGTAPVRVTLARFAQWWVSLERSADLVRLGGAGLATSESAANMAINAQIERLCGTQPPALLRPVTVEVDALVDGVSGPEALRRFLSSQRLEADQLRLLMAAADPGRAAQASIVAIQSGLESGLPSRAHIEQGVVTIIDTAEGRLVAEQVPRAGKRWMIVAPGTTSNIASAVNHMLRRLPADQEWFSYRKVI
jgi:hypothetical protein